MKFLMCMALVITAGIMTFDTFDDSPLEGRWKPDKDYYLHHASHAGITIPQQHLLMETVDKVTLTITDSKVLFATPFRQGEHPYSSLPKAHDCYLLDLENADDAMACVKDNQLELTDMVTGSRELYNKVG